MRTLELSPQVIRLNYDRLPQFKKEMFLDIVNFAMREERWLCSRYKEFSTTRITALINELALDGLIQLGSGKDGANKGEIGVHDLYVDLAVREATKSSKFLLQESAKSMEEMKWENLRRVELNGGKASCFIEKVRHQECRELQVLFATFMRMKTTVHLDCMPSLCMLELSWDILDLFCDHASSEQGMGTSNSDMRISTSEMKRALTRKTMGMKRALIRKLELRNPDSRVLRRIDASRVLRLKGLDQLQLLKVSSSDHVHRIEGLDALRKLRILELFQLEALDKLDGLSGLIQLESLDVVSCTSLMKVPDLSGLARLKDLRLLWNFAMEEVEGLSSSLKQINISDGALKKRLDLRGLTCLERLTLCGDSVGKEKLRGEYLTSNLKHLSLSNDYRTTKEVSFKHLTLLQSLFIHACSSIQKLEVGCHSTLKSLEVCECGALEEVGDLSALRCLELLRIKSCPKLTKLGGLVDMATRLEYLHLYNCESLDECTKVIGGIFHAMN